MFLAALLLIVPSFVFASPALIDVTERAAAIDTSSHCGLFDNITSAPYSLLLNQWGASGATSGSDCANLVSASGTTVAWKTTWTWTGGNGVKSFTNINLNSGLNKQLSAIPPSPATSSVVADVAYDLFTANSAGGAAVNEIMIWLANFNAGPISATFSASGQAVPIVSNLSLAGHTWNLFFGFQRGTVTSFNGDINLFLKYLTTNRGVSTSQFLTTAQGGTEATSGSATLTTSAFSLVIN
ncbi:glycoside hydrolase family 12 protein [Roridomyces roridus]|uniref:Glycoside hydrolase family 12 protein n=1 Tax=Roridomyces roridus TaxID=1738132 RepID=A0AAD7BZK4_9AGAR|nr:glycoside hydrolase family 12 protein [Roridomyces roridus]